MKKRINIYRKSAGDVLRTSFVPLLFTFIIMVLIVNGLIETEKSSKAENARILEDSIRRAIIVNYSIKGTYPESIKALQEDYGIVIDESKYLVHYSIFASNIMPDMSVIILPEG